MAGRRVLVFCLPYWGHLSTCLGVAADLTRRGDDVSFAFAYPPDGWVLREIEGHGHACHWTLRHVRSALGQPRRDEQWRAVVAAEAETIRALRPDVVLSDLRVTTIEAARACGVRAVSVLRCPFPGARWQARWGDAQLTPHSPAWLRLRAPHVGYCRPAWAERVTVAAPRVEPQPVVAALSTAGAQPDHLRLLLEALDGLDAGWVLSYSHPDEAVSASNRVVSWADCDSLLAGARALVCHGGHGLVCRAVMRGLPVVVLQNDAPHSTVYGAALEARRAGILVRRRTLTVAAVREAVARAMDDDRLRAGAAALRRAFEALPEVPEALDGALASVGRTAGPPAAAPA